MNWPLPIDLLPGLSYSLLLVYLRVQAFVMVLPGLGERVLPMRVRVGLAMAISPLLAGTVADLPLPGSAPAIAFQALGQMLIGLALGSLLRILAYAIDIATTAIAATASLSQIIGVQNEAAPHPIGNLIHLGGIAVLMALGLPSMLMDLIADSFAIWPPGAMPQITGLVAEAVAMMARSFALAMLLAAPFTLGGFLYQALSGVINKVMPALPVVFIGSPAAVMLALAALALLAPMLVGLWADAVLDFTLPGAP